MLEPVLSQESLSDPLLSHGCLVSAQPLTKDLAACDLRGAPYWKTYHRDRGHAEAIKIMEKIERRRCDVCGLEGAVTGPRFGVCDACGVRTYCSELCQQGDWEYGGHKEECAGSASNR